MSKTAEVIEWEEINKLAERFQEDCHKSAEVIMSDNKKISYQDATNVWIFRKLAELQHEIDSHSHGQTFTQ